MVDIADNAAGAMNVRQRACDIRGRPEEETKVIRVSK
jgi:hypothetical protein